MELLWVAFSCSLELLHVDMCKVFNMGDIFSLANTQNLVKTGLQGNSKHCTASCCLVDIGNELFHTFILMKTFSHFTHGAFKYFLNHVFRRWQ